MKRFCLSLSLLLLLTPIGNSYSGEFKSLDAFLVQAKTITKSTSGTSVIVIKDGTIAHELHAGFSHIEREIPVGKHSVYYFASTTKSLMAFAVLLAEEKKMLSQNSTLKELFPKITFKYIDPSKYSVKELLSHTSGLSNEAMTWTFSYTGLHDKAQREHFIATLKPDNRHPKGTFNYSNLGYNLMALWFDGQYKKGWQEGLKTLIFDPAGMTKTSANIDFSRTQNWPITKPYSYKYADGTKEIYMNKTNQTLYSVGVFARPRDIAQFITLLMPSNRSTSPFPAAVVTTSQDKLVGNIQSYYSGYGWGWQHGKVNNLDVLLHTGGFDGASVQITYTPSKNIGVIVVHNESGLIANELNKHLTALAYSITTDLESPEQYTEALEKMSKVALAVEKAKGDISEKRSALRTEALSQQNKMQALAGTYHNNDVGNIVINKHAGLLSANWGDLKSAVYPDKTKGQYLLELRPGKFFLLNVSNNKEKTQLNLMGWKFELGLIQDSQKTKRHLAISCGR